MATISALLRLLFAMLFGAAAITKLANRGDFRTTLADFGLPARFATGVALLLPMSEMAVAVLLIASTTAWWGAVCSFVLLVAFTAAIGVGLARGRRPSCRCFGQFSAKPVSAATLWRNLILAAGALVLMWQTHNHPAASLLGLAYDLTGPHRVGVVVSSVFAAALLGQAWILRHVLLQQGRLLLMIDNLQLRLDAARVPAIGHRHESAGLPVGAPAPWFTLSALSGEMLTLDALRERGRPILLVLFDVHCPSCDELLPDVSRWDSEHHSRLTIAIVAQGSAASVRAKIGRHGLSTVLIQPARAVSEAYHVHATPSAALIDVSGEIAAPLAVGARAIIELVARITGQSKPLLPLVDANGHRREAPSAPSTLSIGEAVPTPSLRDLDGQFVDLGASNGENVIVLFWNPGCAFCQRILPDVRSWEATHPTAATQIVMISSGSEAANRAMGLRARIVLDPALEVQAAFGVAGTPSAILLDADRRIASPLAVGAPAVLTLVGAL